jgi:hypothetical protein
LLENASSSFSFLVPKQNAANIFTASSKNKIRDGAGKVLNLFKSLVDYDSKVGLIEFNHLFCIFFLSEFFFVYELRSVLANFSNIMKIILVSTKTKARDIYQAKG